MENEQKPNPNSHERFNSWSELPLDLLSLVFERLAFTDFQRGKSVCSSWYTASRQSMHKKNKTPWLIIFPKKHDKDYFTLLNPEENYKLYKTEGFGLAHKIAIYGNWLLMQDPGQFNLYTVNLFTQERFNLPSSKLQIRPYNKTSFVFWIDEKTNDYVVVLGVDSLCVHYSKKGDTSWRLIPETRSCLDIVYKDHKLYFLSFYGNFKIFDFSGEVPQEIFQCHVFGDPFNYNFTTKVVVTVKGDVLKVAKNKWLFSNERPLFRIYKVCSSELLKQCEKVDSLGDEAMFFDRGITVLANDIEGLNRNSIYLDDFANYVFNFETQKMERQCNFDRLSAIQLYKARWFLPSFFHT